MNCYEKYFHFQFGKYYRFILFFFSKIFFQIKNEKENNSLALRAKKKKYKLLHKIFSFVIVNLKN